MAKIGDPGDHARGGDARDDPQAPLGPTIIRAFGPVLIPEDRTLSASVSFAGESDDQQYEEVESTEEVVQVLPTTGGDEEGASSPVTDSGTGMALLALGVGFLSAAGGLVVYRAAC